MTEILEDTMPRKLTDLVKEVHDNKNALPDFQRKFVWEPRFVAELLESIRHGYPAGSILRMQYPPNQFHCRSFDHVVNNKDDQPQYLVLDGQQRLTSLHNAIYGVGKHEFFINVGKLLSTTDFSEAIFWETNNSREVKKLQDIEDQIDELVIPFSTLFSTSSNSYEDWIREATKKQNFEYYDKSYEYQMKLRDILDPIKKSIENYLFPVVCLKRILVLKRFVQFLRS